ncbi:GIY-YIG nuclease [Gammaproteobacteria bacterium SCGC AG-212-F23]|nr:GIY-YIG nuclease [Gammaproteobacteria bacterium SCGC AG-212-F23]
MNEKIYWVYILHCENNTYYTGYTSDLLRRYQEHMQGSAKCKYTRSFKPVKIAQSWQVFENKVAMKIEKFIKSMSRIEKNDFVLYPEKLTELFDCKVDVPLYKKG